MGEIFNFLWLCGKGAFSFAWDAANIASTLAELGVAVVILYKSKHEETAFKFAARAVLWTFGVIFAGRLLLSPYFVYEDLKRTEQGKQEILQQQNEKLRKQYEAIAKATPTQIDVHETDPEVRARLTETQRELEKANQKIASLSPVNASVVSASATVNIYFTLDGRRQMVYMEPEIFVAIASGTHAIIVETATATSAASVNSDATKDVLSFVVECPSDGPSIGTPVKNLISADTVAMVCGTNLIGSGVKVIGGNVIWVINNIITLRFNIPEQISRSYPQGGSEIIISDLKDGIKPLSDQLLPALRSATP